MKLSTRVIVASAIVLLVIAAAVIITPRIISPENRGVALNDLPQMFPAKSKGLGEIVIKTYREYRANATRWSGVYFTCIFGSAFLSAMAGLLLKMELLQRWPRLRNDVAAISAMLAALLITLSTVGDFQRKWQANRIAASEMENLAYEMLNVKSEQALEKAITEIQAINDARNRGIVGDRPSERRKEKPRASNDAQPAVAQGAPQAARP
jgi:hypothetical protein